MSSSADMTLDSSYEVSIQTSRGTKKVLSNRRRSSETNQPPDLRASTTSLTLEKSLSSQSSPSRDGASSRSGSSGVRKFIPGHSKRKRRKAREQELKSAAELADRGRSPVLSPETVPRLNRSTSSLPNDGTSSLLTTDSESDLPPPLVSRDSHAGYLTTSSPLIKSVTTDDADASPWNGRDEDGPPNSMPTISVHDQDASQVDPSQEDVTALPGLLDKADTLKPGPNERGRRSSFSRFRDKVFSNKDSKSPKTSPERKLNEAFTGGVGNLLGKSGSFSDRRLSMRSDLVGPSPIEVGSGYSAERASSVPALNSGKPPSTPPGTGMPVTTVTPPTPTLNQNPEGSGSPRMKTDTNTESGITVSPSGNMISHRRSRSQSSLSHQPSKLSNSVVPPLTPTIEEAKTPPEKEKEKVPGARNVTPGGSFFSSWMSAAQNAASTITNSLNNHNRSRSDTAKTDSSEGKASEETVRQQVGQAEDSEIPKKQLAIETLGSGDLHFSHLGLEASGDEKPPSGVKSDLEKLHSNSTIKRDEAAAKIEDMLAKRAVSAAYQAPSDTTPVAEITDPVPSLRHSQTGMSLPAGDQSPPNGSVFGDDNGSVKRSTSMRSRIQKRRSRGSSTATGVSTLGAIVGASTSTLANPAAGPKLSGFAVAPKARNRAFHQQFRSVPEDDYLIEDYSCALQKEILLAGRIYISEGHICFSSNILGWVTTLVISFEEVVSIERETTAMVFPNAIAIQTLHARHTFRSLLSREATYDLMIGIWKVSHPASFKKSVNGKQLMEQEAARQREAAEKVSISNGETVNGDNESGESSSEGSDADGSGSTDSLKGSAHSLASSDLADTKSLSRKPSGLNGILSPPAATPAATSAITVEGSFGAAAAPSAEVHVDFPGPLMHAPTECSDSTTHYEKVIKDEVIPAPIGKIYSLLYGPQSGAFVRKYLLDEQRAQDLQLEDDKRGLTNENKSRQYSYIKPLSGSIGPKQTKCITTENLDFFDLERSVSVTCTTQTPDVPSGSAFSVKTRYCLSWAPGNATRLQMNCGIEWTAKSWLKGPIEKGANDGQQTYGDGLVRALRSAVEMKKARERGGTGLSKTSKKRKRKGKREESGEAQVKREEKKGEESWGIWEPVRPYLQPVVSVLGPLGSPWTVAGILFLVLTVSWMRSPRMPVSGEAIPGFSHPADRLAAYEEIWRREESDLWDWLEERVGVENLGEIGRGNDLRGPNADQNKEAKSRARKRNELLGSKDMERRLREEKIRDREMEEQIRITRDRLRVLEGLVEKRKMQGGAKVEEEQSK